MFELNIFIENVQPNVGVQVEGGWGDNLPHVTEKDNGKVLTVDEGEWAAKEPTDGGIDFTTDETLVLDENDVLHVNTTNDVEQDNTRPITSAGVFVAVGKSLPKSGGTMTGALTLNGAPTSDLHAATKKYVDDSVKDISLTPGEKGDPGKDGVSCTHFWNGTTLTVTSASGTSSANLKGEKGDKGDKGDPGDASSPDAVLYTAQELTDAQKAQARANIGAAEEVKPREKAEIIFNYAVNSVINSSGNIESFAGVMCGYTNRIPVQPGDRFAYMGTSVGFGRPQIIWFAANNNIIKTEWDGFDLRSGCLLVTAPAGAAFVMFTYSTYSGAQSVEEVNVSNLHFEVWHVETEGEERKVIIESRTGGYFDSAMNFVSVDYMSAKRTNPIPVSEGDTFYFTGGANDASTAIWYNANGEQITTVKGTGTQMELVPPDGAVLVRFISYVYNSNPDYCTLVVSYYTDDKTLEYLKGMNYLWGKKYVACGDSFTAGDFPAKNDETWDEATQEYKTYCWHIANRNRMKLVNEAKCGSTMRNNGDESAFCLTRYTQVPSDADYITLCFGLNETTATIGTLQDTVDTTVMGAWNKVLEYLITNMPYAKIGIIIPDSWCSAAMREALIDVAEYWGIPYLDLTGDPKVPLLIGGRRSGPSLSSVAIAARNAAFQISAEDSHPNAKGHAYRSTIIENFMRSL